jgi:hypothetical protein
MLREYHNTLYVLQDAQLAASFVISVNESRADVILRRDSEPRQKLLKHADRVQRNNTRRRVDHATKIRDIYYILLQTFPHEGTEVYLYAIVIFESWTSRRVRGGRRVHHPRNRQVHSGNPHDDRHLLLQRKPVWPETTRISYHRGPQLQDRPRDRVVVGMFWRVESRRVPMYLARQTCKSL